MGLRAAQAFQEESRRFILLLPPLIRSPLLHRGHGGSRSDSVRYGCNDKHSHTSAHLPFLDRIPRFLHALRQIYRLENTYHNFEHAVDVLQASYSYLQAANMVPPVSLLLDSNKKWTPKETKGKRLVSTLGPVELFVIYLAAIGHDVGHPGLTNLFMAGLLSLHTTRQESNHCSEFLTLTFIRKTQKPRSPSCLMASQLWSNCTTICW
jgi:hypothetical protein